MTRRVSSAACGAVAALGLVLGCSSGGGGGTATLPTSPQSVNTKVGSSSSGLAKAYLAVGSTLQGISSLGAARNGLAPLQTALAGAGLPVSIDPSQLSLPSYPSDEFSQWLTGGVFTSANVESSDATSVTYRLGGAALCPYHSTDGTEHVVPATGASQDATCVTAIDGLQIRARVTEPATDALSITLLFGAQRYAVATLNLTATTAELSVDLSQVKGDLVSAIAGGSSGAPTVSMSGILGAKIVINRSSGDLYDVTFSASIKSAVSATIASGTTTVTLASEARDPLLSLEVDEIGGKAVLAVNLGQTSLGMPVPSGSSTVDALITLGGLTAGMTVLENQPPPYVLTGVGLGTGDSTITVGGVTVASLSLSPRTVSMSFSPDPLDGARTVLAVDALTAKLFLNTDSADPRYASRNYTVTLGGSPQLEPYDASGTPVLKVVAGTLAMTDGTSTVTVNPGACLLPSGAASPTSLVAELAAGACP